MPNQHGQVIKEDYFAPEGSVRAIAQSMEDGEVEIVADFISMKYFCKFMEMFYWDEEWVITTCDSRGVIYHGGIMNGDFNEDKEQSSDFAPFLVYLNTENGKEFVGFFHNITWVERMRRYYDFDFEIHEKGQRIY